MKPSPYFADRFRYFFKRFAKEQSLFKWFLKKAGSDSGAFSFPDALKGHPKTLVFLPRDGAHAKEFLRAMPAKWFQNVLFFAHESQNALVSYYKGHALYYSDTECRFGEPVFQNLEQKILEFAPQVCIYLGEVFLPRLYLCKKSGAPCRIGFSVEALYPYLNLSLQRSSSSESKIIADYYEVQ